MPEAQGASPVPFDTWLAEERRAVAHDTLAEEEVLRVFRSRFNDWWQDGTEAALGEFTRRLAFSTDRAELATRLQQLAAFHGVPKDTATSARVALIGIARERGGATHGELRGSAIYVEAMPDAPPDTRTGVIAHELAHLIYVQSPADQRRRVRGWFLDHPSAIALPAYALFNEALASAFGNGIVERALIGDERFATLLGLGQSLYADTYVDAAGRAALPLLDAYLADGRRLDAEFVDAYVTRLAQSLGSRLTDQAFWLRVMVFAGSSAELQQLGTTVADRVRTGSLLQDPIANGCGERCLLQRYPELPGIVAVTTEKLDVLEDVVDAATLRQIRRANQINGATAWAVRRSERSLLFIASGPDASAVAEALTRLLEFGQIFEGPLPGDD